MALLQATIFDALVEHPAVTIDELANLTGYDRDRVWHALAAIRRKGHAVSVKLPHWRVEWYAVLCSPVPTDGRGKSEGSKRGLKIGRRFHWRKGLLMAQRERGIHPQPYKSTALEAAIGWGVER